MTNYNQSWRNNQKTKRQIFDLSHMIILGVIICAVVAAYCFAHLQWMDEYRSAKEIHSMTRYMDRIDDIRGEAKYRATK